MAEKPPFAMKSEMTIPARTFLVFFMDQDGKGKRRPPRCLLVRAQFPVDAMGVIPKGCSVSAVEELSDVDIQIIRDSLFLKGVPPDLPLTTDMRLSNGKTINIPTLLREERGRREKRF